MKNVVLLNRRGFLTDNQVLTAHKFMRNPNGYKLAPSFYRVAYDLIVNEEPIEEYEKKRGWSLRSAKVILGLILHAMQEIGGTHAEISEDDLNAKEKLLWLSAADDVGQLVELSRRFNFTPLEGRFFLVLERAGRSIDKETVHNRLYHDRVDDAPDYKIIDMLICKVRKKLKGSSYSIKTVFGVGILLNKSKTSSSDKIDKIIPAYVMHVEMGLSYREIATRLRLGAGSTVMRMVRLVETFASENEENLSYVENATTAYLSANGEV